MTGLLLALPVLLISVIAHEYAHARVAVAQGDATPLRAGRLTLNPLPHLDPFGSFLVPLGLWAATGGTAVLGWARPVPVNPANYREPRRGDLLVSSAGVITNFALAIVFTLLLIALLQLGRGVPGLAAVLDPVLRMAQFGILINLLLAVFNLLPVPPLDGSHLLYHVLPRDLAARYQSMGRYGFLFLIAILFVPGALDVALWPVWRLYDLALAIVESSL